MAKWLLKFTDGTTEEVSILGAWSAWFVGRVKARMKDTYLYGIEKVKRK